MKITASHTLYTPIPHKISRCLNLGSTAKIILLDLIGYMGDKNYCFPPIEDIALNCGISHATVQSNMKELEEKKFLIVRRQHNNTYYLPDAIHLHPYILLSEALHGFRTMIGRTEMISNRQKNAFIKDILKGEVYTEKLKELSKEYNSHLKFRSMFYDGKSIVDGFNTAVQEEFGRRYPQVII